MVITVLFDSLPTRISSAILSGGPARLPTSFNRPACMLNLLPSCPHAPAHLPACLSAHARAQPPSRSRVVHLFSRA
eukprot:m.219237 g.219237  ORF g.219237 m.219237 type:complete len:76 (-) comp10161_c0_seq17:36-263(-)